MLCENFPYPKLMQYFEEISAIPRGSYHEEKMVEYLTAFARRRGLSCYSDQVNNVLIDLPATEGYEKEPALLLQGHTDMVCEKNEGVVHDFSKDPLKLYVEDGWLHAEGTTLGADNGVAVAAMLAILDGASEAHPALQCLFTACEETGMEGALGFDYRRIHARRMLNMDGADERTVLAGCAGGLRSSLSIPAVTEPSALPCLRLSVKGLAGGHSGEDIHRGRANAHKLMGAVLLRLSEGHPELRLISLHGGSKDNAIPRECEAVFAIRDPRGVCDEIACISREIKAELCEEDSGFSLTAEVTDRHEEVWDQKSTERLIFLLASISNGVLAMHPKLKDLVAFSRNLAVVSADGRGAEIIFFARSSLDSQIDRSASELDAYARLLGGTCRHFSRILGWEFSEHSEIRQRYGDVYRDLFGGEIKVEVIHAGLECGVIKKEIPDMDILSCGPVILNLHSPDEALDLSSFARFFQLILEILRRK